MVLKLIQIVTHVLTYPVYWLVKFALGPALPLTGFKRTIVGTCTILAPPKQMETIMQGIAYLRTLDPEMFQRLTTKQRYVFWYTKHRYMRCYEYFALSNNFLLWGNEGIVTCFVQSIMASSLEQSPFSKSTATRLQVQQQVFEWLKGHSFASELVNQYREFAKV